MSDGTLPQPKNPGATILYGFNWIKAIPNGASITGTPTVVASGTGAPTVSSVLTTGTTTAFKLSAGTYNATAPKLTLTATLTNGETLEFVIEAPIAQ